MQDPKDLTNVTCDICVRRLGPKERFVRLKTETLWSMAGVGLGVMICRDCLIEKLGVNAAVLPVKPTVPPAEPPSGNPPYVPDSETGRG